MYFERASKIRSVADLKEGQHFLIILDREVIQYSGYESTDGLGGKSTFQEIYRLHDQADIIDAIKYLEKHNSEFPYSKYTYRIAQVTIPKITTEISVKLG